MENTAKQLFDQGLVSDTSYDRILNKIQHPLFSLNWELRTILYLGVLLFTGGLGVLIYQNIDTIGHQAILAVIAITMGGCFFYCFKQGKPFSPEKHTHESPFFDYILLLGCLLFLTFEGYLQYQYEVFKTSYDLIALLPAFLFLFLAYRFDHMGILSMAITALSAWLGIAITPFHLFDSFDYATQRMIFTGEFLGVALATIGWFFAHKKIKAHFFFTYINFSAHLLFVATLVGLFLAQAGWMFPWFMWLLVLSAASAYFAKLEKSFYFLLIAILYTYIGLTYLFFQVIDDHGDSVIWVGLWYFILSCAGIIYLLVNHKKIVAKVFGTPKSVEA